MKIGAYKERSLNREPEGSIGIYIAESQLFGNGG